LGGRYGPTSKLNNKPLTKLLGTFFRRNCLKQPENSFYADFFFIFGPFWAKKVLEGPQVGGTYGSMSELKDKPLTKLLGPFF
jgi:hypothetical protein